MLASVANIRSNLYFLPALFPPGHLTPHAVRSAGQLRAGRGLDMRRVCRNPFGVGVTRPRAARLRGQEPILQCAPPAGDQGSSLEDRQRSDHGIY